MLDPNEVAHAKAELQTKTLENIHYETAMLWASRAMAAHQLFIETRVAKWLLDAKDYMHEAFEHAALSTEPGAVVMYLETTLGALRRP